MSKYSVRFDDGEHQSTLGVFTDEVEAMMFFKRNVSQFMADPSTFGQADDPDFELAVVDDDECYLSTVQFWNPSQGFHKP